MDTSLQSPASAVAVIRTATAADAPRLVEMSLHFMRASHYRMFLTPQTPECLDALIGAVLKLGVIFAAEVDGQLEGMISLVVLPHQLTGELFGDEQVWWVEPAHRGGMMSIARRLFRVAEIWARDRGATMIKMAAPTTEDGLIVGRFYEACGYLAVETAYQKRLAPPSSMRGSACSA